MERLEQELRRYRAKSFLEDEFEGVRGYEKELINLLKNREIVTSDQILAHLGIDIDDINWEEHSIQLKPHPKRINLTVFFDDECARVLRRWMNARRNYEIAPDCKALFVGERGERLKRHGVSRVVTRYAEAIGLHNPKSKRMEDHFTPHCCRHCFTTWLLRNGMPREYVKRLRGDKRGEAIDIYHHIDKKELRRAYLACIPKLGI